ncbi:MAG: hypothetical protein K2I69_08775 [Muribaculaceae bacterium]|nr:hypothetical protein [Muribaculaceae bacterium]
MKKSLLLACMALMGANAYAYQEPEGTYANVDGYTFKNICINSNMYGSMSEAFAGAALKLNDDGTPAHKEWSDVNALGYFPTARVFNGKIYAVSSSRWTAEGSALLGSLIVFDLQTGELEKSIQLTLDGQPYGGTLAPHVVGVDDFGHLYVVNTIFAGGLLASSPATVYTVNLETGALTPALTFWLPDDDEAYCDRTNYFDLVGDITREQARCVLMAAPQSENFTATIYGWEWEQGAGASEFTGKFDGYCTLPATEVYPEGDGSFHGGTTLTIVRDEEFNALTFYIDDMNSCPALYNTEGAMVDSFAGVTNEGDKEDEGYIPTVPATNPNGVCEFAFGDDLFLTYPIEEYGSGATCRANLVKLGEGGDFSTMKRLYTYPASGLGNVSDGGRRISTFSVEVKTDANGKHGAYLMHFKSGQGFTYNLFAEEGYTDAAVNAVEVADSNAPVEFFNLQGIRVANPENGVFIRRQGANVSKVVL